MSRGPAGTTNCLLCVLSAICAPVALALAGCGEKDESATTVRGGGTETATTEGTDTTAGQAGDGGSQDQSGDGQQPGAGGNGDTDGNRVDTIRALSRNRGAYYGNRVRVIGRATSLGRAGFLLRDRTGGIVVLAPAVNWPGVNGDRLDVTGTVRRFTQFQVGELRESAAAVDQMPLYGRAPLGAGDPYIDLIAYSDAP